MSKPIQKNKIRFQLQKKKEQRQPTFPRLKILYFQFCCATLIIKKKKDFTVECLLQYFSVQRNCENSTWHEQQNKRKQNPQKQIKHPWPSDAF